MDFLRFSRIFQGILIATTTAGGYEFLEAQPYYERAILLIFASCIFDLLDGRLARLGGRESPFGREFDSLADVISFGMAPSLLMAKGVLFPLDEVIEGLGWVLACIYVLCGAIRLAKFNCLAALPDPNPKDTDFRGIPIPMAAGFISSLTFLVIYFNQNDRELGAWKYLLAGAMLGLSVLMISNVRYPSFREKVGWKTRATPLVIVGASVLLLVTIQFRYVMPVILFSAYLLYGLAIRPFLPKRVRDELEDVDSEESESEQDGEGSLAQSLRRWANSFLS